MVVSERTKRKKGRWEVTSYNFLSLNYCESKFGIDISIKEGSECNKCILDIANWEK